MLKKTLVATVGAVSVGVPALAQPAQQVVGVTFADSGDTAWVLNAAVLALLMIFPDMLLFFFHEGPFAWNGIFGFWVPLAGFGSWWIVMFFVLRSALRRDRLAAA